MHLRAGDEGHDSTSHCKGITSVLGSNNWSVRQATCSAESIRSCSSSVDMVCVRSNL